MIDEEETSCVIGMKTYLFVIVDMKTSFTILIENIMLTICQEETYLPDILSKNIMASICQEETYLSNILFAFFYDRK